MISRCHAEHFQNFQHRQFDAVARCVCRFRLGSSPLLVAAPNSCLAATSRRNKAPCSSCARSSKARALLRLEEPGEGLRAATLLTITARSSSPIANNRYVWQDCFDGLRRNYLLPCLRRESVRRATRSARFAMCSVVKAPVVVLLVPFLMASREQREKARRRRQTWLHVPLTGHYWPSSGDVQSSVQCAV